MDYGDQILLCQLFCNQETHALMCSEGGHQEERNGEATHMEKGLLQSWATYPCCDLHHQVTPALLTSWHCLPQNLAIPEEESGTSGSVSGPHYP